MLLKKYLLTLIKKYKAINKNIIARTLIILISEFTKYFSKIYSECVWGLYIATYPLRLRLVGVGFS